MADPLVWLGRRGLAFLRQLADFSRLCLYTGHSIATDHTGRRVVARVGLMQVYFTGVQAVPMLTLIALFLGVVVVVESATTLPQIGASELMGKIFVVAIIRELGPFLTAFVVISRSGTAIAAEIASMVVHDEIAALRVMGITPYRFIIVPRLIGTVVAVVCLTIYFVAVTQVSGYVAAYYIASLPLGDFRRHLLDAIAGKDLLICFLKSIGFGVIISLVSCYHGLSVKQSPTEIPQVVTRATLGAVVWCFVFAGIVTVLIF